MPKVEKSLIGHIDVDSGQVLICDPCYIEEGFADDWVDPKSETLNYSGCCNTTCFDERAGELKHSQGGHTGAGIASSTSYGDGSYPVYAEFNREGRVSKLIIDFEPGEDFD